MFLEKSGIRPDISDKLILLKVSAFFTRFIPESFRWYVSHNRYEDAERVIKFIGRVNGYEDVDVKMLQRVAEAEKERLQDTKNNKKYTLIDVLSNKRLLKFTLLLAWIW